MIILASAIEKLAQVAEIVPEYSDPGAFAEEYEELLKTYPQLKNYSAYLEFLRRNGGAHIHNQDFSLGIYGFGGYVVTSFDEGLFLDQERYFQFGEVLYTARPEPQYFFAFDLKSDQQMVYATPEGRSEYTSCSPSFVELLLAFADGKCPALKL